MPVVAVECLLIERTVYCFQVGETPRPGRDHYLSLCYKLYTVLYLVLYWCRAKHEIRKPYVGSAGKQGEQERERKRDLEDDHIENSSCWIAEFALKTLTRTVSPPTAWL